MNTEHKAAGTLLDRGIKVRVTAPLCLRVFGKKTVMLIWRQPFFGTLARISELYLSMNISDVLLADLDNADLHPLVARHSKTFARIAAQGLLNGLVSGWILGRLVGFWLLWKLKPGTLLNVALVMAAMADKTAFTNTTRLVRNMKITGPNLGQNNQGS